MTRSSSAPLLVLTAGEFGAAVAQRQARDRPSRAQPRTAARPQLPAQLAAPELVAGAR